MIKLLSFNGVISVNKTGAFMFEHLQANSLTENELVGLILDKYEIDEVTVRQDVANFTKKCRSNNLFE